MYHEHFGLRELPFEVTPDPRFFYSTPVYQEAFTGLRYGVKLRKGLMVMTGAAGTGKSTLLRMLAERFESHIDTALIVRRNLDFAELLRLMLIEFGLPHPPEGRDPMLRYLIRYLTDRRETNRIAAVLLDDAHDLDLRALKQIEFLANLQADGIDLLQLVLAGRPELEGKLDEPALRPIKQRITVWCRLEPLKNRDVGPYIEYRLAQAGRQGKGLFEPDAVEQIAVLSKRIPKLINLICGKALLSAAVAGQKSVSSKMIERDFPRAQESEPKAGTFSSRSFKPEKKITFSQTSGAGSETQGRGGESRGTAKKWRWSAEEFMIGDDRRPEKFRRVRNLRGLAIGGFLAFVVVVAAGAAAFYFERNRWFGSQSYDILAGWRQLSERAGGSPAARVIEEKSVAGTSPLPSPSANDSTAYGPTLAAQKGARIDTRVYVHMLRARDRFVLEDVSDALRHRGYIIAYTRVATGRTQGDVRFFFPQDRSEAARVKSLIESELGSRGYHISLELLERDGKKFQLAEPGNIEVWLPPLSNSG